MTDFINSKPKKNEKKGYRFLLSLNEEQKLAKQTILTNTISVINGKAGSGKTLLACQVALQMLLDKKVKKIIVTRPTVSKEDLGFLPGGIQEKMDPWIAPIYGNMYQLLRRERIDQLINTSAIEIVPVSYMRGRTFVDSCVIVDECQNLEHPQIKMILQRIGLGSLMMFCGDTDQIDLKHSNASGLQFLSRASERVEGLCTIDLLQNHRHPILDEILEVYSET